MSVGFTARALAYFAERAIDPLVAETVGVSEREGCLAFPCGGAPGAFRLRSLDGGGPVKVRQPRGRRLAAWWPQGPPAKAETVLVCEGESDALAALTALAQLESGAGALIAHELAVVAIPGTGYAAERLAGDLAAVDAGRALLALDADDAGCSYAGAATEALRRRGVCPIRVELPDGCDVADCLAAARDGGQWLANTLVDALTAVEEHEPPPDRRDDSAGTVALTWARDVRPQSVHWLWRGWLPLGTVSLLVGREGLGKSQILVDRVARLSRGELEGDLSGEPATALVASAEDAIAQVLVPRLIAAGADLERVAFVSVGSEATGGTLALPDDIDAIARRAVETAARLIVIDPLVAYIPGSTNTWRDQHVRRVLAPLAALAEACDLAVLGVMHLNKDQAKDALARVGGSVGFTAAARSVLLLGRDPADEEGDRGSRRVLAHAKCNLAPLAGSLAIRIEGRRIGDTDVDAPIETSCAVFVGESAVGADDLVRHRDSDERSAEDAASDFLLAELDDGELAVVELKRRAEDAGLSWRTIERAKARLGIKARKEGRQWLWPLPTPPTPVGGLPGPPPDQIPIDLGGLGGLPCDTPTPPITTDKRTPPRRPPTTPPHLGLGGLPSRNGMKTARPPSPPARTRTHEAAPDRDADTLAADALVEHALAELEAEEFTPQRWRTWLEEHEPILLDLADDPGAEE